MYPLQKILLLQTFDEYTRNKMSQKEGGKIKCVECNMQFL